MQLERKIHFGMMIVLSGWKTLQSRRSVCDFIQPDAEAEDYADAEAKAAAIDEAIERIEAQ